MGEYDSDDEDGLWADDDDDDYDDQFYGEGSGGNSSWETESETSVVGEGKT